MTTTVRLDDNLENKLQDLSKILHKKKSDIIRDAITFYSNSIEENKKSRIKNAIEKTKDIDKKEYEELAGDEFLRACVRWLDDTPEYEHENKTPAQLIIDFVSSI